MLMIMKRFPLILILLFIVDANAAEINITSPRPGAKYKQGDHIKISATTDIQGEVLFSSLFGGKIVKDPPYECTLEIPDDVVGSVTIIAVAKDPNSEIFDSKEVEIEVLPRISLELLEIVGVNLGSSSSPPWLKEIEHDYLKDYEVPLYIWGRFSDGELHYLMDFGLKFKCQSLDPTVVRVTKEEPNSESRNTCWIILLKPGMARLEISCGDKHYIQKIQVHSTEEEWFKSLSP